MLLEVSLSHMSCQVDEYWPHPEKSDVGSDGLRDYNPKYKIG